MKPKSTQQTETRSPLMQQYDEIRATLPKDVILLFRLGDFYEAFEQDAIDVAAILNITLTNRNGVKMAGIPYYACDPMIKQIVKAGRRVGICDRSTDVKPGVPVKREVTHIIGDEPKSEAPKKPEKKKKEPKPKIADRFPVAMKDIRAKFSDRSIFSTIPALALSADYKGVVARRWKEMPQIAQIERFEIAWDKKKRRSEMRIRCRAGYVFSGKFYAFPKREKNTRVMFDAGTREECETAYDQAQQRGEETT